MVYADATGLYILIGKEVFHQNNCMDSTLFWYQNTGLSLKLREPRCSHSLFQSKYHVGDTIESVYVEGPSAWAIAMAKLKGI